MLVWGPSSILGWSLQCCSPAAPAGLREAALWSRRALAPTIAAFSKCLLRAQAWFEMKIYGSLTGSQIGLITEAFEQSTGAGGEGDASMLHLTPSA